MVKKNFIYNSLYQLILICVPLITTPYLSRVLGAEKIGQYSFTFSIANYFVILAMLGLNNYGNRCIAMKKDNQRGLTEIFSSIYSMQFIMSVFAIGIYILYLIFFANYKKMMLIQAVYVLSTVFDVNWVYYGLEKFKYTVLRGVLVKSITTALIILLVKNSQDIYIYTIIMASSTFFSQLILWHLLKREIKFHKTNWNDIKMHIYPNIKLFIPVVAISLYKIMDKIMLGFLSTMFEVGYYESAEKIIQIPMCLINALGIVMLPRISNIIANESNSTHKVEGFLSKSLDFAMLLSTSMCFGIMAVCNLFVPLFYGSGYEKCITLFLILLPSCIFLAFANVIRTQYLIPREKDTIYIISVFSGALINFIVNLFLIPLFQSVGAAIGTLFAEITVCIVQLFFIRKEINVIFYLKQSIPFVISGMVMFCVIWLTPIYFINIISTLILKIVLGVVIYSIAIFPFLYKKYLFEKCKLKKKVKR